MRVTPEILKELLEYCPDTGTLTWKERGRVWFKSDAVFGYRAHVIWNSRYAGNEAFTANKDGYKVGAVLGTNFRAHRVAIAISYGEWPPDDVDHENGDRSDNRLSNLRVVPRAENTRNAMIPKNNTSGALGVYWRRDIQKWQPRIRVDGRYISLGCFEHKFDAVLARITADREHGYHQNHGRKTNGERN